MPTGSEELIAAASQGDTARVQRFLADDPTIVDARDCFGETALMRAAKSGSFWTVAALITSGANTRLRSNASKTALQLAVDTRRGAVVKLLTCVELQLRKIQFANLGKR